LWLFRGVALVLAPVLFLLLFEATLCVGGYGYRPTVTVPCRRHGISCRGDNVKFAWRFFRPNVAQEFDPFLFPTVKPVGTYRIFILGESAAQGTPDPAYSFGRLLEAMLDHAYPDRDFEVIVAAMPAINSHVIVEIARDLARYEPDLFVVYAGNNEVVGPYGPGTVFAPLSPRRALIRAGIRLKATRTGQFLADAAARMGADGQTARVWRGLEMFESRRVAADDPRLEITCRHFRRNLEDIRRLAVDSRAGIVFCTVGANLRDCPPFVSLHRAGLSEADATRWTARYDKAVQQEVAGDYSAAIEDYLAAADIDDRYADLQFRLGRCYWVMGNHEKARERFLLARDLDALRLRPDRRINEIIRAVAAPGRGEPVWLVDAEEVFRADSPFGVPGRELFHEHVHLTFHGNYLLAQAVGAQVRQCFAQGGPSAPAEAAGLDEATCAERVGYNAWAHYDTLFKVLHYYIRKPPFTNQLYHRAHVQRLEREVKEAEKLLTAEVRRRLAGQYRDLIEKAPGDMWLRLRFAEFASVWLGDEPVALEQCRRVQELVPHSYKPHLLLALSLGRLNRLGEAAGHLQEAIRIKPTCSQAWHLLGLACRSQGQPARALAHFQQAIALQPDDVEAYQQAVELLLAQSRPAQAERLLRRGLSVVPEERELHRCLATVLRRQGRSAEADQESEAVTRPDPNSFEQ
jgi:tetratricopeptide (TPR) repeat protein